MKYGRFLLNIFDPKHKDAQRYLQYSYHAHSSGPEAMQAAWDHHLDWINQNVVGLPKATKHYTQDKLREMNMVGIYAPVKSDV